MAEVLGVGLTHYPLFAGADSHMANLLKSTLKDPDIPSELKDPSAWRPLAQEEWGADGGVAAAAVHRARLLDDLDKCRDAIDEFEPDVLMVWGDDQYENFREEVIPSFCILAYTDTVMEPFGVLDMLEVPNVWGMPNDSSFVMQGAPDFAKDAAAAVLGSGVDVAYSYRPRDGIHFPHAFGNTQLFLDYDNVGTKFPYPIVPMAVNCYGEHVIARKGGALHGSPTSPPVNNSILRDRHRCGASSSGAQSVDSPATATSESRSSPRPAGPMRSSTTRDGICGPTPNPIRHCTTPWLRGTTTPGTPAPVVKSSKRDNMKCLTGTACSAPCRNWTCRCPGRISS